MTPRVLRDSISSGKWESASTRPPSPPAEWTKWRRERMRVSIRAAWLFCYHGQDIETIRKRLSSEGLVKEDASKQRMAQYVKRGASFLLDRAAFREIKAE